MRVERRIALGAAVIGAALAAYYYYAGDQYDPIPPRPTFTGAAAVVERFECYRCHEAEGVLVSAHRERSCVACHQAIHAGELDDRYDSEAVEEWRAHIIHLRAVPSLTGIDQRFRRDWLVAFLREPHDLRPNMDASMPRLRMSAAEAETIAAFFIPEDLDADSVAVDASAEQEEAVARGRALFETRDCARCHHYSGSGVAAHADPNSLEARLAPDLRHTRARSTRTALLRWLADPAGIKADTLMPPPNLDEAERHDVAAFILDMPLEAPPRLEPPAARLSILTRPVTHREVDERVFRRICRHCHADPEPMDGEGGPGNTGGYGFRARGIDFSSYEAITASPELFENDGSGAPLLVAALWRRHLERAGEVDERRGMPLGLPPMSLEDIQLVETWLAQGAPE